MRSLYQKMVNRMGLWNTIPDSTIVSDTPVFDKKYATVISFPTSNRDTEKIMWINDSISGKSVDVKFTDNMVHMAFEDDSDALIFRIKFL